MSLPKNSCERSSDPNFQYGQWLSSPPSGDEVVISGMSGRLPESNTIEDFMNNLHAKKEMITENDKRWMISHPEIPPRTAKLLEINKYDAGYFGVHYRQAQCMDPMMRVIMESVIEAIVDAGLNPSELEGSKTGVFTSMSWSDMENETFNSINEDQNNLIVTGCFRSLFSHRISYRLKLKGPAFNIDTACSSSLNALDSAFKTIRAGYCDNAIVIGTSMVLNPGSSIQFFRLGVLSPDAVCRVFDQDANGYVRAEAIGCVFLQKAKNSRRIYATVINTKASADGFKTEGITFPSMQEQKVLMKEIYEESGIEPSDISFMEAHGTGTQVGDPQEVEAIDSALAQRRSKPLLVGSVKCSIGHSEAASGICSIIKVLLAMETGLISPNINLKQIKKELTGIVQGRMKVVTELTKLKPDNAIVGINNFGFGGNNAHVVLRRFKKNKLNNEKARDDSPRLICASGRTDNSVFGLLNDVINKPFDTEYVALLYQIFKIKNEGHLYRGFTILTKHGPVKSSVHLSGQQSSLYLVFGSFVNNFDILAEYLLTFSVLKTVFLRINEILEWKIDTNFEKILSNRTQFESKILGSICVQLAVVDILKLLEIYPIPVYSDSYSKLVVAYYNGVISLEEAVTTAGKLSQFSDDFDFSLQVSLNNTSTDLVSDSLNINKLANVSKNSLIVNVSDSHINNIDMLLIENNCVKFLETLGRIYERGHDIQIHKLYPETQFPVSRGTSMISPSIKWNHKRDWYTYQFAGFKNNDVEQQEYYISYFDEDFKFTAGHVINGRNLFPATGYLYLVWETYAQSRRLLPCDIPVIFTNCKFIRGVTQSKGSSTRLLVNVQRGTGYFEILEINSLVANGFIKSCEDIETHLTNLDPIPFDDSNRTSILEQDEIYRELYLRGYNYSGLFKGIELCNVDASAGLIKWEDNWTSFIDKMLQMAILQADTRLLYVPTGIKKIVINPAVHLQMAEKLQKEKLLFPAYVYKESNLIKAGGIEISGLQARSIFKKKPSLEPVLEKSEFIPNHSSLKLSEAVRVNTQLILEISLQTHFKAVEIVDNSINFNTHLIPFVCSTLDDLPMIIPDLTISSKFSLEAIPGVKIENVVLTADNNLTLLMGTKILSQVSFQKQALNSISKNGFVLTREDINFVPESTKEFEILTEYLTSDEKLILLQKRQPIKDFSIIEVSSSNYDWLPKLQDSLKKDSGVLIYAKNGKTEGILGLTNCIRREPNGSNLKCFFMMDESPEFDPNNPFYSNQIKKSFGVNVYKNGTWGTYRHLRLEKAPKVDSDYYYANVTNRGDISSLKWLEASLNEETPLDENAILIYPYYSANNFKDIMAASGRVNLEALVEHRLDQECPLGFEFSGRDSSGRRVIGMTNCQALASHIIADKHFLWEVPDSWSLKKAASVPVVYSTVLYALSMVTELKPQTSILIHSGTGAIGLAALNVCLFHKYEIFVTVGTQEKRDYLKKHYPQIPVSHIGNSRDTSFEEMVKTETKGRGVDLVLNSLSDDKLKASVRCLARGGKFLEIGKYDLSNDSSLDLLFIEKEASYHGIMLDRVILNSQEKKSLLVKAINNGIALGYIKPLPTTAFNKEEIEASYRYMMTGKHIGKVVVKIRDEETTTVAIPKNMPFKVDPSFNCDKRYSYVIIGGLGGIGLELADWLVLRKAKKLILVSRIGIQSGYQMQRIRIWKSYGVEVQISTDDVTSKKGCINLITNATQLGPVDAIFNLAVILKDALLENQTAETFSAAYAPKAKTTIFLDEVTRKLCPNLRYFVVFSSVSCGRGNPGQSNYGFANSIMERICEKRKEDGFPALAIQWGAIGDVGLVAKMQKENKELVIGGTLQQKISSCLQVLDTLLTQDNPIVSSMVVAEKHNKNYGSMSAVESVAFVLGIKDQSVSRHTPLAEMGMDSMTGTEIIQLLENDFDIYVPPKDIRSITFARLEELEAEKNQDKKETGSKTQTNANMLIQFIPDKSTRSEPVLRLTTQLQENEEGPTIFLFPGIQGVFDVFKSFVKSLKAHVFGMQYDFDNPKDTIQETAEYVLQNIKNKLSKEMPFFFICYSYGVVVGLEVISDLEKKGYNGKLILIEGSPSYLKASAETNFPGKTETDIQSGVVLYILSLLLPFDIILQHKDKLLSCETLEDRIEFGLKLTPLEAQDKQKLEKQGAITLYKRLKAIMNYKFTHNKVKADVHLLKAQHSMVIEDEDYKLTNICESRVKVSTLNGDHVTILNQPELASYVNEIIDKL